MYSYRKYNREIIVITSAQIPAKWCGIFDYIDFTQVLKITAAALANYYPQSLFIYCEVHSTVSTPLVILFSCIVTAHTYLSFLSSCQQIVLQFTMLQVFALECYREKHLRYTKIFKTADICFHNMDSLFQGLSQVPRSYQVKGDIKLGKNQFSQNVVFQSVQPGQVSETSSAKNKRLTKLPLFSCFPM